MKAGFLANLSFERKLRLIIMVTCFLALLVSTLATAVIEYLRLREQKPGELQFIASKIAESVASYLSLTSIQDYSEESLESLSLLKPLREITAGAIYLSDGTQYASYPTNQQPGRVMAPKQAGAVGHAFGRAGLSLLVEVQEGDKLVGYVYLESDLSEMYRRIRSLLLASVAILVVALGVAWMVSRRLQRVVTEPVLELAGVATRIANERNYSLRVQYDGRDELGRLYEGFNEMLSQIQGRDQELLLAQRDLEKRVQERTGELEQEVIERRSTEDRLRESESLYQSLVNNQPVNIYRKDRNGRFTFANTFFCKTCECRLEQVVGRTDDAFMSQELAVKSQIEDMRGDRHRPQRGG